MKPKLSKFHWGVLLGNIFDHYDTALYGLLAPFLAHHFFPADDPLTAIIIAYALMPSSMIMKPLGSIFFGMIGDLYGGKNAFTISLVGVTMLTTSMAFLPTYDQVGYWAPILLTLARMLQSFFAAGELSSSGVLLMENTPVEQKNIMSGFYNASTMGGILLASLAVTLLGIYGVPDEGWRILYFLGSITLFFVYFLRKSHPHSTSNKTISSPKTIFKQLWNHKIPISIIAVIYGFSYSCYVIAFTLINALLPYVTTLSKVDAVKTNTFFMVIDFLLLPFFAWVGNFVTHRTMLLSGTIATILFGIPLFAGLEGATLQQALIIRFLLMIIGVSFSSTVLPWSQKLLPDAVRFTGTSVAFALGTQLIGIPTTALSLWIYQQTLITSSAGWYWVSVACVSLGLVIWSESRVDVKQRDQLLAD